MVAFFIFSIQGSLLRFLIDDDKQVHKVKFENKDGKIIELKPARTYAVVNEGIAYVGTAYGFFELKRVNSDLMFIGTGRMSYTGMETFNILFYEGYVGGIIANDKLSTWQFKLDHISGKVIPVRQLQTAPRGNALAASKKNS